MFILLLVISYLSFRTVVIINIISFRFKESQTENIHTHKHTRSKSFRHIIFTQAGLRCSTHTHTHRLMNSVYVHMSFWPSHASLRPLLLLPPSLSLPYFPTSSYLSLANLESSLPPFLLPSFPSSLTCLPSLLAFLPPLPHALPPLLHNCFPPPPVSINESLTTYGFKHSK